MIKRTRLMEYIRVLSDAEQILSEYDTDKRVVMDDIELELRKIGGSSLLKNMIEDYLVNVNIKMSKSSEMKM